VQTNFTIFHGATSLMSFHFSFNQYNPPMTSRASDETLITKNYMAHVNRSV
jgi:hypothetical protein